MRWLKKNVWRFFFAGLIVTTILFFINESFKLGSPINHEKFASYGTMIASLLTAVTVYLLFDDRRKNNLPDLFIKPFTTKTEDEPEGYGGYPRFLQKAGSDEVPYYSKQIKIPIYNIGLGVAKNVFYEWVYDESQIEKYVENNYKFDLRKAENGKNKRPLEFISQNQFEELLVPDAYQWCLGIKKNRSIKPRKPTAKIKITYEDVHGHPYSIFFSVLSKGYLDQVELQFYKN